MGIVVSYGSFSFDSDTVAVSIQRNNTLNEAMQSYITTHQWELTGQIQGTTQNDVISKCALMETAFSLAGKDLIVLGNDGSTVAHSLLNAGSVSGVRVTRPPSYPRGDGTQLTTFRDFTISLEADYYFAPQVTDTLKMFNETVNISGGGPLYDLIEMTNGPPVFYRVRNFTPWRATQSGSAVGLRSRPNPQAPIWPGALLRGGSFSLQSPHWMGKQYVDYGIAWQYEFASAEPLVGEPGTWPTGV